MSQLIFEIVKSRARDVLFESDKSTIKFSRTLRSDEFKFSFNSVFFILHLSVESG